MNREKIKFKNKEEAENILSEYGEEPNELYELIEENERYFDSEKGYVEYDVIIKRRTDSKFFKGSYLKAGGGYEEYELDAIEVFPEVITTTIYK